MISESAVRENNHFEGFGVIARRQLHQSLFWGVDDKCFFKRGKLIMLNAPCDYDIQLKLFLAVHVVGNSYMDKYGIIPYLNC
jgi:hypothetical protein